MDPDAHGQLRSQGQEVLGSARCISRCCSSASRAVFFSGGSPDSSFSQAAPGQLPVLLRPLGLLLPGPPPLGDQGDWKAAGDCDGDGRILLFLDLGGWGDGAAVDAGGQAQGRTQAAWVRTTCCGPQPASRQREPPKLWFQPSLQLLSDSCLELVGIAEATLLLHSWGYPLHILGAQREGSAGDGHGQVQSLVISHHGFLLMTSTRPPLLSH